MRHVVLSGSVELPSALTRTNVQLAGFASISGKRQLVGRTRVRNDRFDLRLRLPDARARRVDVAVMSGAGRVLHRTSFPAQDQHDVSLKLDATIDLGGLVSKHLADFLAKKRIRSVADLHGRNLRTLRPVDGRSVEEIAAPGELELLEAHARLAPLTSDSEATAALVAAQLTDVGTIARSGRDRVIDAIGSTIGSVRAARLHAEAVALERDAIHRLTAARVGQAHGVSGGVGESDPAEEPGFEWRCGCKDCLSGVSPLAYLADLVGYAADTVEIDGVSLGLDGLEAAILQPVTGFPASCDVATDDLLQVRICVEALRSREVTPSAERMRSYLFDAYERLLNEIGTSYAELRLSRKASDDDRAALATRLGLGLVPAQRSEGVLDELLLEATSSAAESTREDATDLAEPASLSEDALERLFGLVSTSRDPLLPAPVDGDDDRQLLTWRIDGVASGLNTDEDGQIHASLDELASGPRLRLYRHADRTPDALVATAAASTGGGFHRLRQNNHSGLSGFFATDYQSPNDRITIGVIPRVACWRLHELRRQWAELDHPPNPYLLDALPLIDPDIVGLEDLRLPGDGRAERLWTERWNEIQRHLTVLRTVHEADGVEELVSRGAGLTLDSLERLHDRLTSVDGDERTSEVLARLGMTPSAFARLYEVIDQHRRAAIDPEIARPLEADWHDVYAILTGVWKMRSRRVPWCEEERADGLIIGPADFWGRAQPPTRDSWPFLEARAPAIDPERDGDTIERGHVGSVLLERRRAELDRTLGEIRSMRQTSSVTELLNRTLGDDHPVLLALRARYDGATRPAQVAAAVEAAWDGFRLEHGQFIELTDFISRDDDQTDAAWSPIENILLSAHTKRVFHERWRAEERALPRLDPRHVPADRLPPGRNGDDAREMRQQRDEQLGAVRAALEAAHVDGIEALLVAAFGDPPATTWREHVADTSSKLDDPDARTGAVIEITTHYAVTTSEFTRLAAFVLGSSDGDSAVPAAEWASLYAVLADAHADRLLAIEWTAAEAQLRPWNLRPAPVSPWRDQVFADGPDEPPTDARVLWTRALEHRRSTPVVDPYVVDPSAFRVPSTANPAFALWHDRRSRAESRLAMFDPEANPTWPWLAEQISVIIGVPSDELLDLEAARGRGASIGWRLDQLDLAGAAFDRLVTLIELAQDGQLLDDEWREAGAILVAVAKRRLSGRWHVAEQGLGATPDHFVMRRESYAAEVDDDVTRIWLGDDAARRDWRAKLESRIEQAKAVAHGLAAAVRTAERSALPILRDGLLDASDLAGTSTAQRAAAFGDSCFIDAANDGCAAVTRVSQAIESIQRLLLAIRNGTLQPAGLPAVSPFHDAEVVIADDDFDQTWRWLGSYGTWRAAMFVFMYPELVLEPSLRRDQTTGFRELVTRGRAGSQLTPTGACELAAEYRAYLQDIADLELGASCHVETRIPVDGDCGPAGHVRKRLLYNFGWSPTSHRAYWTAVDPNAPSGGDPAPHWRPIPDLKSVVRIIGAVPYRSSTDESLTLVRHIYLFVVVDGPKGHQLVAVRYDLEQQRWDSRHDELDLPIDDLQKFQATIKQRNGEHEPPQVVLRLPTGAVFRAGLSDDGGPWQQEDWRMIVTSRDGSRFTTLLGCYGLGDKGHQADAYDDTDHFVLVAEHQPPDASIYYKYFGDRHESRWHPIDTTTPGDMRYVGGVATSAPELRRLWIFLRSGGSESTVAVALDFTDRPETLLLKGPDGSNGTTLAQLNTWLAGVFGLDLDDPHDAPLPPLSQAIRQVIPDQILEHYESVFRLLDLKLDEPNGPQTGFPQWWRNEQLAVAVGYSTARADVAYVDPPDGDWRHVDDRFRGWTANPPERPRNMSGALVRTGVNKDNIEVVELPERDAQHVQVPPEYHPTSWGPFCGPSSTEEDRWITDRTGGANSCVSFTQLRLSSSAFGYAAINLVSGTRHLSAPRVQQIAIGPYTSAADHTQRRATIDGVVDGLADVDTVMQEYAWEAAFHVPLQIGRQLHRAGHYRDALDWYRSIADLADIAGRCPDDSRLPPAIFDANLIIPRPDDWLDDPLDPHRLAALRDGAPLGGSYLRFFVLATVQCLLDFADAEFSQDTSESVARARALYEHALEWLSAPTCLWVFQDRCQELLDRIPTDTVAPVWRPALHAELRRLDEIGSATTLRPVVEAVIGVLLGGDAAAQLDAVRAVIDDSVRTWSTPSSLGSVVATQFENVDWEHPALSTDLESTARAQSVASHAGDALLQWLGMQIGVDSLQIEMLEVDPDWSTLPSAGRPPTAGYQPRPQLNFCIPPNPLLDALKLRAEVNLFKIRTCRNFAGMLRELEPYAAPTDTVTGLPSIGSGGALVIPGATTIRPTPYRYAFLIERAKELARLAGQFEQQMFSAIQAAEQERYGLFNARQDIALSKESVQLQTLRVRQAEGAIQLADLQQERAELHVDHFTELIQTGLLQQEREALGLMMASAAAQTVAAAFATAQAIAKTVEWLSGGSGSDALGAWGQASSYAASSLANTAGVLTQQASYQRREADWKFQQSIARKDVQIGRQSVRNAEHGLRVVEHEREVAELRNEQANDTLEFLSNKFTNVDLYDWMSDVVAGVYSYFLGQATSTAQLAATQLAFERQSPPPVTIRNDYWEAPSDSAALDESSPDRRGLTGSARLLRDIQQLDDHAFRTDDRKLNLQKTISLAQLDPLAFQRFTQTGNMIVRTPQEMFDRDFPGHYLRLIKRVRVSVIALVPPVHGIKAMLRNIGTSRSVIGGDIFQVVDIVRDPQSIALTSPVNATGVFELDPHPEMLLPFEGLGVDTSWELDMPKASNPFDYSTIADVLLTIEYTALEDFVYRERVLAELGDEVDGVVAFSLRNHFPDQWYELNNPDQSQTPMTVELEITDADFPPNITDLRIEHVAVAYQLTDETIPTPTTSLHLRTADGSSLGGTATSATGVISTQSGSAASWIPLIGASPTGRWSMSMDDFADLVGVSGGNLTDIAMMITYSASSQ